MRKGEELKAPRYASTAVTRDYITTHNIIPNNYYYQIYIKLLNRFKFTLKDDYEFNYIVIINVIYLDSKPVLQVVDSLILF